MSVKPLVSETDHIQGNVHAPVELIKYADFQCNFCAQASHIVKAIQIEFGQHLKFVFRHFPLSKVHPEAKLAAVAAEAAGLQGKFWQMHDIIFENQRCLYASWLMKYAEQIGLDTKKFEADLFDEALIKKVESDFETGIRSGVQRTPVFFVNGEYFKGNWKVELSPYIQSKIDALLQQHNPNLAN